MPSFITPEIELRTWPRPVNLHDAVSARRPDVGFVKIGGAELDVGRSKVLISSNRRRSTAGVVSSRSLLGLVMPKPHALAIWVRKTKTIAHFKHFSHLAHHRSALADYVKYLVRNWVGGSPTSRLKAAENAFASLYPSRNAMLLTESP